MGQRSGGAKKRRNDVARQRKPKIVAPDPEGNRAARRSAKRKRGKGDGSNN